MENAMLVQVDESLKNLVQETLRLFLRKRLIALLLHILLQVKLKVFEDQEELVLRVDDFFQLDDVGMLKTL